MLVPVWRPVTAPIDVIRNRAPIVDGAPVGDWNRFGAKVSANTGERLRYQPGVSVPFGKNLRWSAGAIILFNDLTTDQQTIFAKSVDTSPANAPRQIYVRTETDGAVRVAQDSGPANTVIMTTAASVVSTGVNYYVILTCDGAEGLTLWVLDLDARSVALAGDTGTYSNADVDLTQEVHLLAHFTAANDDLDGDLSLFWYLKDYTMSRGNVYQLLPDPFGGIRMAPRRIGFVAAAPGGLSIPIAAYHYNHHLAA